MTPSNHPIKHVIIVGAGPSGLILSLLLSRSNPPIRVTLLELSSTLDTNPRAAHYAPSACYELNRSGVLDEIRHEGFHPDSVCWRRPDGSLLGGLGWNADEIKIESGPMVCLPLGRLDALLLRHLLTYETAEVLFKHKVLSLGETQSGQARVQVEVTAADDGSKSTKWMEADYIVGADGATSQVRRCIHGDMNYPGETLGQQIIATNVYYDFERFGYWDSNFIVHPEDWYMAAKITKDGLWRVTYGDTPGLTTEQYLSRQPDRYKAFLPGSPTPDQYELVSASPYKLHQRCAPSFYSSIHRALLVADAAHLCNPFGGLGLTGGIADVGSLYDALMHIQAKRCDEEVILEEYSRVRTQKWKDVIDPMSRKNFDLIWNPSDEAEKNRLEFWAFCEKLKEDKKLAENMANSTHGLRENFDGFVREWGDRRDRDDSGVGTDENVVGGEKKGASMEHVEASVDSRDAKQPVTKTKILGYGTTVAVD